MFYILKNVSIFQNISIAQKQIITKQKTVAQVKNQTFKTPMPTKNLQDVYISFRADGFALHAYSRENL